MNDRHQHELDPSRSATAAVLVAGLLTVVHELTQVDRSVFRLPSAADLVQSGEGVEIDAPLRFGQRLVAAPEATVEVGGGALIVLAGAVRLQGERTWRELVAGERT